MADPDRWADGIAEVVDRFVRAAQDRIVGDEQLRAVMERHLTLEEHAAVVGEHVRAVLAGAVDPAASRRVGDAHVTVGLPPSGYLSVYNLVFAAVHQVDPAAVPPLPALRDRWLTDACQALDAYHQALLASWSREREQLHADVDRFAQQASTDELTGLLNRRGFVRAVEESQRAGTLILVDLDNFKALNDHAGHPAGDAVLRTVGEALSGMIRAADAAGRLGGDEFAVWLEGASPSTCTALLRRLRGLLPTGVGLSAGAADSPPGRRHFEELHRRADELLYADKRRRKTSREQQKPFPPGPDLHT